MSADQRYHYATGRRKSAVARVRLYPGTGDVVINDRTLEDVFPRLRDRHTATQPFALAEAAGRYRAQVKVRGGGISAWADAVAHGIARALVVADENARKPLRRGGFLTRDPRVKERKKYGLKRARKAPQYTKR
ncbi:MAG: 30S ribosomal protein S9 [Dehalococcoidia bacterium]